MHGLDDPLVSVTGGLALAKAIPGATFIGHHGMGHDLPGPLAAAGRRHLGSGRSGDEDDVGDASRDQGPSRQPESVQHGHTLSNPARSPFHVDR